MGIRSGVQWDIGEWVIGTCLCEGGGGNSIPMYILLRYICYVDHLDGRRVLSQYLYAMPSLTPL